MQTANIDFKTKKAKNATYLIIEGILDLFEPIFILKNNDILVCNHHETVCYKIPNIPDDVIALISQEKLFLKIVNGRITKTHLISLY